MIRYLLSKYRQIGQDKKVLLFNFFSLSYIQAANYILPFITLPYLLRVIPPEKFGLLAFAAAMNQYFSVVIEYGFIFSATSSVSLSKDKAEDLSTIFSSVMLIKASFVLIAFVILNTVIVNSGTLKNDWVLYYLVFGSMAAESIFPAWFFQGVERINYIAYYDIIRKTIFTIAIFIFIRRPSDYIYVPLLNLVSSGLCGFYGFYIAAAVYKIRFIFKIRSVLAALKDGFQFFLSRLYVTVYTLTNTMIIGNLFSMREVAYYNLPQALVGVMRTPFDILNRVVYPYMARHKQKSFIKKVVKISAVVGLLAFIAVLLSARYIILLFGGKEYVAHSVILLRILSMMIIFVSIHTFLGAPILTVYGHQKHFNFSMIIGALFYILAMSLAYFFKILNVEVVAVITILIELLILAYRYYYVNKLAIVRE